MNLKDYAGAANEFLSQSIVKNYKFCKEYMDEYKNRKREIHYLQHDIDLKTKEIERLTNLMKEEDEQMHTDLQSLKEDAIKFNEYLKQSDKVCVDAIKRAELESKLKQEKLNDLRQLNNEFELLKNDILKKQDLLAELKSYEEFFQQLGNKEWTSETLSEYVQHLEQENLDLLIKYQEIQMKNGLVLTGNDNVKEEETEKIKNESTVKNVNYHLNEATNVDHLFDIVKSMHLTCVGNQQPSTILQMLSSIEQKVQDVMEKFESLTKEEQTKLKKAVDKKMRQFEQDASLEQQKQKLEEKSKRKHAKKRVKVTLKKKIVQDQQVEIDVNQEFFWNK